MFKQKLKRLISDISRKTFLEKTNIPPSTLSIWLTSDVEPDPDRQIKICKALGLPDGYFFRDEKLPVRTSNNMTVTEAAKLLGCSVEFIHRGLQQRVFPWGYAVECNEHWAYYINGPKLREIERL